MYFKSLKKLEAPENTQLYHVFFARFALRTFAQHARGSHAQPEPAPIILIIWNFPEHLAIPDDPARPMTFREDLQPSVKISVAGVIICQHL